MSWIDHIQPDASPAEQEQRFVILAGAAVAQAEWLLEQQGTLTDDDRVKARERAIADKSRPIFDPLRLEAMQTAILGRLLGEKPVPSKAMKGGSKLRPKHHAAACLVIQRHGEFLLKYYPATELQDVCGSGYAIEMARLAVAMEALGQRRLTPGELKSELSRYGQEEQAMKRREDAIPRKKLVADLHVKHPDLSDAELYLKAKRNRDVDLNDNQIETIRKDRAQFKADLETAKRLVIQGAPRMCPAEVNEIAELEARKGERQTKSIGTKQLDTAQQDRADNQISKLAKNILDQRLSLSIDHKTLISIIKNMIATGEVTF